MGTASAIALDLLREAAARRWFIALGLAITLLIATLALTLRLEVVGGALAATRLFGSALQHDIRSAEVALRPVYLAATYTIFYGGLVFGILACSDFAPELLAPGRIEHLLSLPVRRWELLLGTFAGVLCLAVLGTLYGAVGFTVVLSVKSGTWTIEPVAGALLACVAFAAVYAAMLAAAVFARSAALSAACGGLVLVWSLVASHRSELADLFGPASARAFLAATAPFPRVEQIADAAARIATGQPFSWSGLTRQLLGSASFAGACVALAVWQFERRDY